ncbi:MAG: glucans biosynthesis glucosyltransferase MdoH [Verrucomicrobiota bacterium]
MNPRYQQSWKSQTKHMVVLRVLLWLCITILSIAGPCLFLDFISRYSMTTRHWFLFIIYIPLNAVLVFGFAQALFGFYLVMTQSEMRQISQSIYLSLSKTEQKHLNLSSKTALLFPVYNEDTSRFYAGVETTYRALKKSGHLDAFDIFILSDSTNPNRWIAEEEHWLSLIQKLDAEEKIYYRHRFKNLNQKSGNISDFCRRWGSNYDHMICFDADSLMTTETLLSLVLMMEKNPQVGIIQTSPRIFQGETLFARLQQFANRIHGEISSAGLNLWQQSGGNYWGHNGIIRMAPFIKYCTLPALPGNSPLGGRVLSHDFVEAALIHKQGYEIWLAHDLEGSYEECPPTLLDFASRDRRWCQGNLQHIWIALFGEIPFANRTHMINGILAYLSAPLWLLFLLMSTLLTYSFYVSNLSLLSQPSKLAIMPESIMLHGLIILSLSFVYLFGPKLFTIIRLLIDPAFAIRFGGFLKASISVLIEVVFFSLLAPLLMLFHSAFVLGTLIGQKVQWNTQNRDSQSHTSLTSALAAHGGQTLVGLFWAILAGIINPFLFFWASPIFLSWLFAPLLSIITSHHGLGLWFKKQDLLLTPEEVKPCKEIKLLEKILSKREKIETPIPELVPHQGLIRVALDPYVNALHYGFLRPRSKQQPLTQKRFEHLVKDLILKGPDSLSSEDRWHLLNDSRSVENLHNTLWKTNSSKLCPWWSLAISRFRLSYS